MTTIDTEDYKGYRIEIHYDESMSDPFTEMDQMGEMLLNADVKRNMSIPKHADTLDLDFHYGTFVEEATRAMVEADAAVVIPFQVLYLGSQGWSVDIGEPGEWEDHHNGCLYATRATIRSEYNVKIATKSAKERAAGVLTGELETFAAWLNGYVYGYIIKDEDDETIDSLWGMYGEPDGNYQYPISEARGHIDWHVKQEQEKAEIAARRLADKYAVALAAGI